MEQEGTDGRVRSGVFPKQIQTQNHEAEQELIRGAKLALANIQVKSMRRLRAVRALTLRNVKAVANQGKVVATSASTAEDTKSRASQRWQRWGNRIYQAWRLCGFLDAVYVLCVVPYRVGFLYDPWNSTRSSTAWSTELLVLTVLDIVGCVVRSISLRRQLKLAFRRLAATCLLFMVRLTCGKSSLLVRMLTDLTAGSVLRSRSSVRLSTTRSQIGNQAAISLIHREGTLLRQSRSFLNGQHRESFARTASSGNYRNHDRDNRLLPSIWNAALTISSCFPWEILVIAENANYLHLVGLFRLLQARSNVKAQFAATVVPAFSKWRGVQVLSFSTVSITAYLFVIGIYLCHIAACGYMLIAHIECGAFFEYCSKFPTPEAWVLRDNLENGSNFRKYVRTLYWGCKTVVTLGQGDLIPVTLLETAYRVCIQFASGLWATAIVTGYSFYFTHKDANMSTNISTQLIQAKRFLRAREVTPEISNSVSAYFYYMERTRNGVEEAIIVSNMPPHYRSQCSNYVKFKCFGQIPIFRNRQGAFLRTILGLLEKDFFTPNQTVVHVGEKEEMLIIASGTVRIIDVHGGGLLVGRLVAGTSYAEYALFEDHSAQNLLISDTFCELWRLSRRSFEMAVHKHFARSSAAGSLHESPIDQHARHDSFTRNLSLTSMQTSARLVKLAGKGSTLMKAFARKGSNATIHKRDVPLVITWRHPQSRFRRHWIRLECALLSFLLWEVPYQIAFQRGFGLLNNYKVHPTTAAIPIAYQQLNFFVSVFIELFFLIDLVLRAFFFVTTTTPPTDTAVTSESMQPPAGSTGLSPSVTTEGATTTRPATTVAEPSAQTSAPVPTGQGNSMRIFHEKRAVFRRYRETEPGWWFDIVAILPISLVWDILPKEQFSGRLVQIARFARLLRLLRVRHMRRRLKLAMVDLGFAPAQRLLVYIILLCVTVANLAGCLFFLVGDAYDFHGGLPAEGVPFQSISWQACLESASLANNCTWYMYDRSTFNIDAPYLRSLHWSIVLLSTVGYGDIVSFSTIECVIGCLWIFLGANICYFTSSALSSVLDQLSIVSLLKDERVEELNVALLGMPTVSDVTKQAIRSFYEMKWKLNGSTLSSDELALRLPRTLRRDLWFLLYLEDFHRCTLFADCSESDEFVRELALVTTSEIFLKHIVVAREGHLATEFFLIQSGECECLLPAVRIAPRGGARRQSNDRMSLLLSGNLSVNAARAQMKKKHAKKTSILLEPRLQTPESSFVMPRKDSGVRRLARATFSAPASTLPAHVHHLQLQHKKSTLFKSAANFTSPQNGNPPTTSVKRAPSPRWLQMISRLGELDSPAKTSAKKQVSADAKKATAATPARSPMTLPKPAVKPIRRRDTLRSVVPASASAAPLVPIPVLMLKQNDYFGEESILDSAELYDVTVRVVSSVVQVAVVRRSDFLAVAARFPRQVASVKIRNQDQRALDRQLLQTHRSNFVTKPKVGRFFFGRRGDSDSSSNLLNENTSDDFYAAMSVESSTPARGGSFVLDPEARFAVWWRRIMRVIFVYNFFAISFRVAFLWYPKPSTWFVLTTVDYASDLLLYIDLYLKYGHMGYVELGEKIMDPTAIRQHYRDTWLWADCASMLPLYFITGNYLRMTLTRIPRLIRSVHLAGITADTHTYIQENYLQGNTLFSSLFDLVKFFLIFMSTAHYASCFYYLLGRVQIETGLAEQSWISTDPILLQHSRSPTVHYMRAFYWCLSTFTVDCFGDIWARNFLETCFAMFTCALGWIFIGQVIGRINALMITLDKDRKQRDDRIDNFQQYAKQRRLPESLRSRALEGLHYKSECLVSLRLGEILRDLPAALRTGLFYELYGPMLHSVPELNAALAPVQLEALSSALYLEIYLHGDVIYEAGRMANRLYLLQNGIVEVYSAISGVQYGLLEASMTATNERLGNKCRMFGEFAFFLRGARRLTSIRALRSCQILQLDRSVWNRLWPRPIRRRIERALLPLIEQNYQSTARAYLNIEKNLFVRSDAPMPSLMVCGRDVASVVAEMEAAPRWWVRPARPRGQTIVLVASHDADGQKIQRRRSSGILHPNELPRTVMSLSESEQAHRTDAPTTPSSASGLRRKSVLVRSSSLTTSADPFEPSSSTLTEISDSQPLLTTTALNQENAGSLQRKESFRRVAFNQLNGSGRKLTITPPTHEITGRAVKIGATSIRRLFFATSVLTELQWKRHEKRLRALQLFAYGWTQVQRNVKLRSRHLLRRRRSINIVEELHTTPAAEQSACGLHTDAVASARMGPRRHSLQIIRADLDNKFKLNDIAIPTLAARITAHLTAATRMHGLARRRSTVESGASSAKRSVSRRISSVNFEEDPDEYDEDYDTINSESVVGSLVWLISRRVFACLTWPVRKLVRRFGAPVTSTSSKVAPAPGSEERIQTAQAGLQKPSAITTSKTSAFAINSRFRRIWSSVMLAATAYSITISPYRVSFMDGFLNEREIESWVIMWFAVEFLLIDSLCIVDFILHRSYFAYVDGGETITDSQAIAEHYWQHGSYILDVVSIIPIEVFLVGAVPLLGPPPVPRSPNEWPLFHSPSGGFVNWHSIAFLKLNRFLRVVHLHSLSDEIQFAMLYESKSLAMLQLRPGVLYLVRLAFDFLLGTHWLACLFFGISYLHYQDGDISWLTAPGMLTFNGCEDLGAIRRVPVAEAYLRSFHFSIGAITTVCYGDILPMNAVENAATLAVIFVSIILFSILSGGFFKFFAMELGTRAEFEERVAQVGHFMAFHSFPADMWTQMKVYFALSWQESKGKHEEQQLSGLPTTLRQDIARLVHANLIQNVRLFQSCEEPFSKAIIAAIKHEFFVRNDVIIQRGDMERSLYIVETGLVIISAVRKKKASIRASMASIVDGAGTENHRASMKKDSHSHFVGHTTHDASANEDHEDSVNEWLALASEKTSGPAVPTATMVDTSENAVVGVVSPSDPPDINTATERAERIVKGPFDFFGERSLLFGTPRNATCVAACVSSLFVLTSDRFEAILEEFPSYRSKVVKAWVMTRNRPVEDGSIKTSTSFLKLKKS